MNNRIKIKNLCTGGVIAALYVIFTMLSSVVGLSSGAIQIRFSEALCVLPIFSSAGVPGLFVGCLLANILTGANIFDVIFGSIATLLGALGTYFLRKTKVLFYLPPIIANTIIVPLILKYIYNLEDAYWALAFMILIGESISVVIGGSIVKKCVSKLIK